MTNAQHAITCSCGSEIPWPREKGGKLVYCPQCGQPHHFKNNKNGRRRTHTYPQNVERERVPAK